MEIPIHMNGRIYEPTLGRMLSPDPVTQAPENGQGSSSGYTFYFEYLQNNSSGGNDYRPYGGVEGVDPVRGPWHYITINGYPWVRSYYREEHLVFGTDAYFAYQASQTGDNRNSADQINVVGALTELLKPTYWVGLRFKVSPSLYGFTGNIDINLISHECAIGQTCTGNELTQGFTASFSYRNVKLTIVGVTRSSENSLDWSDPQFSFFTLNGIGPFSVEGHSGGLTIGFSGGFLVGGSLSHELGKLFGACHGGARCEDVKY